MYKYVVFVIWAVVSADNCANNETKQQSEVPGFVGFSASLDEIKTLTPGQTVKYTNVLTNAGNHYNPHTGVFTAPRTAYYLFHIHAITHGASGFWFQLTHNDIPRVSISESASTAWSTGGNSALLKVEAGHRVYVKAFHLTSEVYGDGTHHYTTFTGHLAGQ